MDRVLRTPEVNARRARLCHGLHGRVLEIGFGTGLNLRFYPADMTEILVVEPSASAMQLAEPRKAVVSATIKQVGIDGAVETGYGQGPRPFSFLYQGRATRPLF
jgi:hypothetical protein